MGWGFPVDVPVETEALVLVLALDVLFFMTISNCHWRHW
jgi:hypothetical protein